MEPTIPNPEFELLLAVAQSGTDLFPFVSGHQIDWDYLLGLAIDQGMFPLLHLGLKETRQDSVPDKVLNDLKAYYFENTQSNIMLLGELVNLLKLLDENGIEAVPFKGVQLSKVLYNSFSIRQAGDIDILAKPEDVLRIIEIIQERGYEPLYPYSTNQQIAILNTSHENRFNLVDLKRRLSVEVHWRVFTRDLIGSRETKFIWDNLEETTLQDVNIKVFKPDIMVMYLCFHAFKHNWSRIFVTWEIDKYLSQYPNLDWPWILDHVNNFGGENVLLLSLSLTRELFEIDLPQIIDERIKRNQYLQEMVRKIRLTPNRYQLEVIRELDVRSLRDQFTIQGNLPARIKQFLRFALIPNHFDITTVDLPPGFHFLYFAVRPLRLVGKGIKRVFSKNKVVDST